MLGLKLWNLMYACEREKSLHLWDELFPPLRTQALVFKEDYLLAFRSEAVGPGQLWKPWPLASDTQGNFWEERGSGMHSEPMVGQRRSMLWIWSPVFVLAYVKMQEILNTQASGNWRSPAILYPEAKLYSVTEADLINRNLCWRAVTDKQRN